DAADAPEADTPKQAALRVLREAETAWMVGDLKRAEQLVARAARLGVPESAFAKGEPSPARMALRLRRPTAAPSGVVTAAAELPTDQLPAGGYPVAQQALHVPETDRTQNRPVASLRGPALGSGDSPRVAQSRVAQLPPLGSPALGSELPFSAEAVAPPTTKGPAVLLAEGEQFLREGDLRAALSRFRAAEEGREELDPSAARRLAGHLRMLDAGEAPAGPPTGGVDPSILAEADRDQQVLARQVSAELTSAQSEARRVRETEPRRALELLEEAADKVARAELAADYRDQLTRRVERSIAETEKYIDDNRAKIELDERNAAIEADVARDEEFRAQLQAKVTEHVDEFNQMVKESRYPEAEVVARRLIELAPRDPVAKQVWENAKQIRRTMLNDATNEAREMANWDRWQEVESAAIANVGDDPIDYPSTWNELKRRGSVSEQIRRRTQSEIEIERRLQTPVQLNYQNRPLSEVMDSLSQMVGVNIDIDQRGLAEEGVSSDTPITKSFANPISLRSALNLILDELGLGFAITNEVLKISSKSASDGELRREVYYVADLVIPIPDFVPNSSTGMQGLINEALLNTRYSAGAAGFGSLGSVLAGGPDAAAETDEAIQLASYAQNLSPQGPTGSSPSAPIGGALGGGAQADFTELIELITTTTGDGFTDWVDGGGEQVVTPSFNTSSLVVNARDTTHQEIADLLEQLRRLQDLQITVEVRFIRLSDDFFERIGIDFDMNINDQILGTDEIVQANGVGSDFREVVGTGGVARTSGGAAVGIQAPLVGDLATVTADLDIPFRQGSFNVAQPTIGGFNPSSAANFGFAILSDIEAYFLINAAQGDSRTSVLNAPKVTLFNGQNAFVQDVSERPFVISVVPVVGEFAAAQQPVIVVLREGTTTSIQATVSDDRRYVRMTVVPFFSQVGDIETFTFDGSTTTNQSASSALTDDDDDGTNESSNTANDQQVITAGTTVQQPTFQNISVSTTVSVPDGGTVLLGGIKRLSEGREEFGVPLLSKIPYINRLFRNVGIGRETDSLMLMVTPRIIIQEEEEERLGLAGN
ncbi:MAG: hypothetical protein AAF805_09310, partial [Planctomycetota bacterium]